MKQPPESTLSSGSINCKLTWLQYHNFVFIHLPQYVVCKNLMLYPEKPLASQIALYHKDGYLFASMHLCVTIIIMLFALHLSRQTSRWMAWGSTFRRSHWTTCANCRRSRRERSLSVWSRWVTGLQAMSAGMWLYIRYHMSFSFFFSGKWRSQVFCYEFLFRQLTLINNDKISYLFLLLWFLLDAGLLSDSLHFLSPGLWACQRLWPL